MNNIILVQLFLPLVAALNFYFFPMDRQKAKVFSLLMSLLHVGVTLGLVGLLDWQAGAPPLSLFHYHNFMGLDYAFAMDGINGLFIVLNSLTVFFCMLQSCRQETENYKLYYFLFFLLGWGMNGCFLGQNLLTFFFLEEMVVLIFFLMVHLFGRKEGPNIWPEFGIFSLIGPFFFLSVLGYLGFVSYEKTGMFQFSVEGIKALGLPFQGFYSPQGMLFWGLVVAFFMRSAFFPFQGIWGKFLQQAPFPLVLYFYGILMNLGLYGPLKFALPAFREASLAYQDVLMGFCGLSILAGGFLSFKQRDLRKALSYTSLCSMGAMGVGIFVYNHESVMGSLLKMANHSLTIMGLYLLLNVLKVDENGNNESDAAGVGPVPRTLLKIGFFILLMNAVGLPGLPGLFADFFLVKGVLKVHPFWAAFCLLGLILIPLGMTKYYRSFSQHFQRKGDHRRPANHGGQEAFYLDLISIMVIGPLLIVLGVFPGDLYQGFLQSLKMLIL